MTIANAINLDSLTQQVKNAISLAITEKTITEVVRGDLEYYANQPSEARFQKWYFETVSNTERFLIDPKFFHEFKTQYALQGISNEYLDDLWQARKRILDLIDNDELETLYHDYFYQALTSPNRRTNQNVFFTKLVHTFKPADYCVLDSKTCEYFGLEKECFRIAFYAVSRAYREWATENRSLIRQLRQLVTRVDKGKLLSDSMTDLKLLDLVLLREAKKQPKRKGKV